MIITFLSYNWEGIFVSWVERHLSLLSIFTPSKRIKISGFDNIFDWLIEFYQCSFRCISHNGCFCVFKAWSSNLLIWNIKFGFTTNHSSVMQNLERWVLNVIFIIEVFAFKLSIVSSSNLSIEPKVFHSHLVLS